MKTESDAQEQRHLPRLQRIREKLQTVRLQGLSCFGSNSHHFELKPPLGEPDLAAFETRHRIRLPADYRCFLKHLGGSGAGPFYGIYPLGKWDDFATWVLDEIPDDYLSRPCPLHPGTNPQARFDEGEDCRDQSILARYQGTLALGTQGCSGCTLLMVTGEWAGRVVYADADGLPPYVVREADFLAWYERWLDELLNGHVGNLTGPGGGAQDFFRILDDLQANAEERTEAMAAFCRLPSLEGEDGAVTTRIMRYLDDPVAGVRAAARSVALKFSIPCPPDVIGKGLTDPDAAVRTAAVSLGMKAEPARWQETVWQLLLDDPDREVRQVAFQKLKEHTYLGEARLRHLIERHGDGQMRQWAASSATWEEKDADLLARMLHDQQSMVRTLAVRSLAALKATRGVTEILSLLEREQGSEHGGDHTAIDAALKALGVIGDDRAASTLLQWCQSEDDFHRLEAIGALALLGDARVMPFARTMLGNTNKPRRYNSRGMSLMSNVNDIGELVRRSLRASPDPELRQLADERLE